MATSVGTYRFLRDHYVGDAVITAGTVQEMFSPWEPTPDVDPLDTTAVAAFYAMGPVIGSVQGNRTAFSLLELSLPFTYWVEAATVMALTSYVDAAGSMITSDGLAVVGPSSEHLVGQGFWTLTGLGIGYPPISAPVEGPV